MIKSNVLSFGEFKTKSGRLTPYFVNTGNYRTGKQIATLGKFYANLVKETCGNNFDCMFGPALQRHSFSDNNSYFSRNRI